MQKSKKSLSILLSFSIGILPLNAISQVFEIKKEEPTPTAEVVIKPPVNKDNGEVLVDKAEKDELLFVQEGEEVAPEKSSERSFSLILQLKDYPLIEKYLSNGANINHVIHNGNTIVNISSFHRDSQLLLFAAANKANLSHLNNDGESILYWGGAGSKLEYLMAIKQVMTPKAFAELMATTTKRKRTPLHGAILYDAGRPIVEWLLANNVVMEAKDEHGQTALHYAAVTRKWDALEHLLQKGGKIQEGDGYGMSVEDYILEKFDGMTIGKLYPYLTFLGKQKIDIRLGRLSMDFAQQLKTTGFGQVVKEPINK